MNTETFVITATDSGISLIKFLQKKITTLHFNQISQLLRKGCIKKQGIKITTNIILAEGDYIELHAIIARKAEGPKINLEEKIIQSTIEDILYKNEDFIALNKKEGLAVQGGSKIKISLDDIMNYLTFERNNKPKLVHRLDRETSGLILLARHDQSARDITALFRNRNIKKYYLAICSGQPKIAQGTIKAALPNNPIQNPNNLPTTHYKLLSSYGNYALMQFEIETGKKHQIRIHSAGLGLPILGDAKYGGKPATRLFLHSHEMIFQLHNQTFHIKAPISTTFIQTLSRLNLQNPAN